MASAERESEMKWFYAFMALVSAGVATYAATGSSPLPVLIWALGAAIWGAGLGARLERED